METSRKLQMEIDWVLEEIDKGMLEFDTICNKPSSTAMETSRKLQMEINWVLEEIDKGVLEFDTICNKVYDTDNANLKEKFQGDLIEKLQRYYNQIETWLQSSEVDSSYESALIDARKHIECEIERFKVCMETKRKFFSKESPGQQPKTVVIDVEEEQDEVCPVGETFVEYRTPMKEVGRVEHLNLSHKRNALNKELQQHQIDLGLAEQSIAEQGDSELGQGLVRDVCECSMNRSESMPVQVCTPEISETYRCHSMPAGAYTGGNLDAGGHVADVWRHVVESLEQSKFPSRTLTSGGRSNHSAITEKDVEVGFTKNGLLNFAVYSVSTGLLLFASVLAFDYAGKPEYVKILAMVCCCLGFLLGSVGGYAAWLVFYHGGEGLPCARRVFGILLALTYAILITFGSLAVTAINT